jgi:hypothetical protein
VAAIAVGLDCRRERGISNKGLWVAGGRLAGGWWAGGGDPWRSGGQTSAAPRVRGKALRAGRARGNNVMHPRRPFALADLIASFLNPSAESRSRRSPRTLGDRRT